VNAGAITNSGEATLGPAAVAYARNCRARRSVSAYGCLATLAIPQQNPMRVVERRTTIGVVAALECLEAESEPNLE